jgi:hypothetical protein
MSLAQASNPSVIWMLMSIRARPALEFDFDQMARAEQA